MTTTKATEEPVFIPHKGTQLFAVLHAPEPAKRRDVGIVFCDPFAEEKLWAQRLLVNFARTLAREGFWVLRFDCRGHGDSGGEFEESTVGTRLSDIARATAFLKERMGRGAVGVFGLRFGGTLAALAAGAGRGIAFAVLWQPVMRGEAYFQECLRSNLATQMAIYKKIVRTREDLVRRLGEGKPVNVDGYLVSPDFHREASAIDLQQEAAKLRIPLLLVQVSKAEGANPEKGYADFINTLHGNGVPAACVVVRGEPFWKETRWYIQAVEPLFAETLRWVKTAAQEGEGRGGAPDILP
ncbi:MAG TPA: alpha/beta hydrolase [bacterium]